MTMISPFFGRPVLAVFAVLGLSSCQSTVNPGPDRFDRADRDGNGLLSAAEVSDYFVGDIFDARDTNKDGKMTQEEWNPAMEASEMRGFKERDANGDGVVTREEAMAFARRTGVYGADTRAADTNKDGMVSREEAVAYYASKE